MSILFFIFCFSFPFAVIAANGNSLPTPNSHFAAIDSFYAQKLEAELAAFESNPKDYWMNFVPSVGAGYAIAPDKDGKLKSKLRPSISFSLNSILAFRKEKQQIKALKESIILKNHIEKEENKIQVSSMLQKLELLQEDLAFSLLVFEIDQQLF